jgi:hypothetical protein
MHKKLGVIVDGPGDHAAIKSRFPRFHVLKTDGPRGDAARVEAIVAGSRKQVAMLQALSCDEVIILMDFENRPETYEHFLSRIRKAFDNSNLALRVAVAIPNRMIENWYLADIECLCQHKKYLKKHLKQKNYEGTHGKRELKKCFIKGIDYCEIKHGPELFLLVRPTVASANSASFRYFLQLVE